MRVTFCDQLARFCCALQNCAREERIGMGRVRARERERETPNIHKNSDATAIIKMNLWISMRIMSSSILKYTHENLNTKMKRERHTKRAHIRLQTNKGGKRNGQIIEKNTKYTEYAKISECITIFH